MSTPVLSRDLESCALDPSASGAEGDELEPVFVHLGEVFASADPVRVTTILGSCLSICLWDPVRGIGGINHYLLVEPVCEAMSSARIAPVAMRLLLAELTRLGADPASLRAKVFGGASLMYGEAAERGTPGARNIAAARELLAAAGIPIVEEEVGGTRGRQLHFRTDDGSVEVRNL